jgi:hypothetical protein
MCIYVWKLYEFLPGVPFIKKGATVADLYSHLLFLR